MTQTQDSSLIPGRVLDYLNAHKTLTLATASPSGLPHAATMVYVNDDRALYFWSGPGSTTVRNIERNPAVALTVDDYTEDWTKTKGVQASGECFILLDPAEIQDVVAIFQQKFPFLNGSPVENVLFFRVTPAQLSFIDNEESGEDGSTHLLGLDYRKTLAFSVFRDLPVVEADTVAGQLETVRVAPGEIVVRQGAPADKFFIIVDGEVDVVREAGEETRPVARLGPAQFFGEIAILRGTPRNATVRAVTETTLLMMDREHFKGLMAQSLATTEDFDRLIRERLEVLHAADPR